MVSSLRKWLLLGILGGRREVTIQMHPSLAVFAGCISSTSLLTADLKASNLLCLKRCCQTFENEKEGEKTRGRQSATGVLNFKRTSVGMDLYLFILKPIILQGIWVTPTALRNAEGALMSIKAEPPLCFVHWHLFDVQFFPWNILYDNIPSVLPASFF
jgi:hypothetical protein